MTVRTPAVLLSVLLGVLSFAPAADGQERPAAPTATVTTPTVDAGADADADAAGVPAAPSEVQGVPLDGAATVRWRPPGEGPRPTGYVVRRDGEVVARVGPRRRELTDTGLLAEVPVTYTVAAVGGAGEGPESAAVVVVPSSDSEPGFRSAEAGTAPGEGQTEQRAFTYSIATRGTITADVEQFSVHVAHTLNDPRGWSLGGSMEFRQVASGGDFTVWLAEASTVPSFSAVCSATYSCRVGRNVIINQTRWLQSTPSWTGGGGDRESYRHYVVVHETGHWLGSGHLTCPGPGQLAPVMQQQSISLQGCARNGWPLGGERAAVSSRTGATVRPVGPESDSTVWGQVGDQVLACDWNGDGVDTEGVFRDGTWYVRDSLTGGEARSFTFGRAGDVAVCGDWNGTGGDGIGVVRGSRWFLRNRASAGVFFSFLFGDERARPVAGDWDGQGGDGIGRVRDGRWKLRSTPSAGPVQWRLTYGRAGDQFVPGDWDGDGVDEPGVVRGATWFQPATWWPGSGGLVVRYGAGAAIAGRWDGLAVAKPGRFLDRLWAFRRYSPTP